VTRLTAAALVACVAAYGAHLVYSALALGWRGVQPGPRVRQTERPWLPSLRPGAALVRPALAAFGGLALGFLVFAAPIPALVSALIGGAIASAAARAKRDRTAERASEAWPGVLEEIRVLTGAGGRPIPQALFEAGRHAPLDVRPAFAAAQREWQSSTDFGRALSTLKAELAEVSTDVVCETLLVAHQIGGTGVGRRLEALIEDRNRELQLRRDARSRQAGARFARRFVLIVPVGMAFVGLSLGTGREAYRSAGAQLAVVVALTLIAGCWAWAGRILRIPRRDRVFAS
jgi:tight adherence protein B